MVMRKRRNYWTLGVTILVASTARPSRLQDRRRGHLANAMNANAVVISNVVKHFDLRNLYG